MKRILLPLCAFCLGALLIDASLTPADRLSLPAPTERQVNSAAQPGRDASQPTPGSAQSGQKENGGEEGRQGGTGSATSAQQATGASQGRGATASAEENAAQPESAGSPASPASGQSARAEEGGGAPQQGASASAARGQGRNGARNALASVGEQIADVTGEPLKIPQNAQGADFLAGDWAFDRFLKGENGETYRGSFQFDALGNGSAILTDSAGNAYEAAATAEVADDLLRILTGPFANAQGELFGPQFIECVNTPDTAVCSGTDGFARWAGERLLASSAEHSGSLQAAGSQGGSRAAGVESAARSGSAASTHSGQAGTSAVPQPGSQMAELGEGGADLPPDVLNSRKKAAPVNGQASLSSLQGEWLYSKDLARKDNGRSVGLEFSFDAQGKGKSVIRDDQGKIWEAAAEAALTPNGAIRVKTSSYGDGTSDGFYPTFMECTPENQELACDVSNGWSHLTGGRLVAANASAQAAMEDILGGLELVEAQNGTTTVADILGGMPELDTGTAPAEPALAIPESPANMDFLQGKWRCNTGLVRSSDNKPVVVEFSFGSDGTGNASIREESGKVFTASAKGSLNKQVLRINTSEFHAPGDNSVYFKTFIECRNQGEYAICSGENGGIHWSDATFTRVQ